MGTKHNADNSMHRPSDLVQKISKFCDHFLSSRGQDWTTKTKHMALIAQGVQPTVEKKNSNNEYFQLTGIIFFSFYSKNYFFGY